MLYKSEAIHRGPGSSWDIIEEKVPLWALTGRHYAFSEAISTFPATFIPSTRGKNGVHLTRIFFLWLRFNVGISMSGFLYTIQ